MTSSKVTALHTFGAFLMNICSDEIMLVLTHEILRTQAKGCMNAALG